MNTKWTDFFKSSTPRAQLLRVPVALMLLVLLTRWGTESGWVPIAGRQVGLFLSALLAVLIWWCVLEASVPRPSRRQAWKVVSSGMLLAVIWGIAWLTLPGSWLLLKAASFLMFTPVFAWMSCRHKAFAAGLWVGHALVVGVAIMVWRDSSVHINHLRHAISPTHLSFEGAHFEWSRMMVVLSQLSAFGSAENAAIVTERLPNAWLPLGVAFGWWPMSIVAWGAAVPWALATWWLRRSPTGEYLWPQVRRLGVGIGLLHVLAVSLYAAWSMGGLYRPMGVLPPLAHAGWGVLTLAFLGCLYLALFQRRVVPRIVVLYRGGPLSWGLLLLTLVVGAVWSGFGLPERTEFWKKAQENSRNVAKKPSLRPVIWDRSGKHVLAENRTAHDVWLHPRDFTGSQASETLLSALEPWPDLKSIAASKLNQVSDAHQTPRLLIWAAPSDAVAALQRVIRENELRGLKLVERPIRYYPQGQLTAHAVGFASLALPIEGQAGLEAALDYQKAKPTAGAPSIVITSLDLNIQRVARAALQQAVEHGPYEEGAVVIADAETGGIVAMTSWPDFDPNKASTFRNPLRLDRIRNHAADVPVGLGYSLTMPLALLEWLDAGGALPQRQLDNRTPDRLASWLVERGGTPRTPTALGGLEGLEDMPGVLNYTGRTMSWITHLPKGAMPVSETPLTGLVQAYLQLANPALEQSRLHLLRTDEGGRTTYKADDHACQLRRWSLMENSMKSGGIAALARGDSLYQAFIPTDTGNFWGSRQVSVQIGMVPIEKPRFVVGTRLGGRKKVPVSDAEKLLHGIVQGLLTQSRESGAAAWPC